jgi:transcriptional regulator with XRE-family HTH domain
MDSRAANLTSTLRQARKARRLSQFELSTRVGVSQRHVSFVENGRARPGRELLVAWLQVLEAPLALRNEALLQAGYAPLYGSRGLDDPSLAQARLAMSRLLDAHDPMPALLLDAEWNVLQMNRGAQWLAATLLPWAAALPPGTPVNLVDLFAHPDGFSKAMLNLAEAGPPLLAHLRHDALAHPALQPRVDAFAALLRARLGDRAVGAGLPRPEAPLLTTRFATPHGELAFFSLFTTFGTPQDITLESLRVEHLFAADEATHRLLARHVLPAS